MVRLSLTLSILALILSAFVLLVGCAPPAEETGSSEGAASEPVASFAGSYDVRIDGQWDGSLKIKDKDPWSVDFTFDVMPDVAHAPSGRLKGTASLNGDHYTYEDGSCEISIERVTDERAAALGDIFVNASITCAILMGIDEHTAASTAPDLTATWRRVH